MKVVMVEGDKKDGRLATLYEQSTFSAKTLTFLVGRMV
jgi:hypothetical protein